MQKNFFKLSGMLILTLVIFTLSSIGWIIPASKVSETNLAEEATIIPSQEMVIERKRLDGKAIILRDYFAKYDSPLQDYTQDFIDAADTYQVDWKLVPAIAGVESTFGKNTPGGYNGWGWGVYANQALYFKSWRDGIFTVTKGLKENYINRGLITPYQINYAYAASPYWGSHVSFFMLDLEKFSKTYPQISNISFKPQGLEKHSAGSSASLQVSDLDQTLASLALSGRIQ